MWRQRSCPSSKHRYFTSIIMNNKQITAIGLGTALGTSIGTSVGAVIGDVAMGTLAGSIIGTIIGVVLSFVVFDEDKEQK